MTVTHLVCQRYECIESLKILDCIASIKGLIFVFQRPPFMPPPMGSMPPPPGMLFPPGMPPVPAAGAHTLPPTDEIWVENKTPEGKVENGLLLKGKIDPFECCFCASLSDFMFSCVLELLPFKQAAIQPVCLVLHPGCISACLNGQ